MNRFMFPMEKNILKSRAKSEKMPLTQTNFFHIRDYLLTYIILDNGSRLGALVNMTLGEFSAAIKKDKAAIIKMKKHKIAHILPACLTMRKELMREVPVFIRTKLDGIGTNNADTVFSSWNDGEMDSPMVSQRFDSFWKSALGKAERMNPTLIRKLTSTIIQVFKI